VTDEREGTERNDDRFGSGHVPGESGSGRPAYVAPELVEYGTVAKLTQAGGGSFNDAGGMMMMMACL
jgi:hypothetical protein